MNCDLCGLEMYGCVNNAAPYEGFCCDACNILFVIPMRLYNLRRIYEEE